MNNCGSRCSDYIRVGVMCEFTPTPPSYGCVGTRLAVSAKYSQTKGEGRYTKPYTKIRLTVNLRRACEGDTVRKRMLSNKDRFYSKSAVKRLDEAFCKNPTYRLSSPSLRRRPVGKVSFRHKGRFVYFADRGKVKALAARACKG